jgi:hypothetical protein
MNMEPHLATDQILDHIPSPPCLPQSNESPPRRASSATLDDTDTIFRLDDLFDLFDATMTKALNDNTAYNNQAIYRHDSDNDSDYTDIDDGEFGN